MSGYYVFNGATQNMGKISTIAYLWLFIPNSVSAFSLTSVDFNMAYFQWHCLHKIHEYIIYVQYSSLDKYMEGFQ